MKLQNALRIDRAFRFVWQAGPGWAITSIALILIQGVLPLLSLYLIKLIIDEVSKAVFSVPSPASSAVAGFSSIITYICIAAGVGILTAVCGFLLDYVKKAQTLTVTDYMFTVLHEKSVSADLAYYESPEYLDTLHRAQREGPYRPTSIINGLITTCQSAVSLVVIIWLLVSFSPWIPLLIMAAAIPGILMRLNYSDQYYSWRKKRTEEERKENYFNWIITDSGHAKELRLFGLGPYFIDQFKHIRDILRNEKLGFERRRAVGDLFAQSSATLAVFGSFIYIAFRTVSGSITLGDMVMYFQAVQRGLGFLTSVFEGGASLYEDNLFLSYLYDFLEVKPNVKDPENPIPVPVIIKNGFSAENLTFKYRNCEKNVIDQLRFDIRPGEVVALVGENGAGKSTLVKLLCRLYDPDSGAVHLDRINIKQFRAEEYRKKIAVVFQDYIRYYLSTRENIHFGNISIPEDDERILQAADKAGIGERIHAFPSGLDTPLGHWIKGGEELSVGQWQMVALARAFYRDADLVILDEPASSLDVMTEYRIFEKFRDLIKGKSALIISHRFSTVRMADRIMLLENGTIAEQGSHDELMRQDGKYAALFRKQAEQYQSG